MRKALIVGINNYTSFPLNGCINDAIAVANLIESNGDGSPNFGVLLKTNVSTKGELRGLISELFAGKNDVALFYFSGHGQTDGNSSCIVTPDYTANDYGVSMDDILRITNESQSTNKIIILDCCFSGAFGSPSIMGGNQAFIGEGVTILTASKKDESSVELCGHGVFTTLLLEALKGGAADITGSVTPGSVYSFIDQALGPWKQRPVFKTNISQFLPLRTIRPAVPRETLRKIIDYFPSPDMQLALDPSYEFTNDLSIEHEVKQPYANPNHVEVFKDLQKYVSVGLVEPVGADHMYFAAMESKFCKLTALGWHYWKLTKEKRI